MRRFDQFCSYWEDINKTENKDCLTGSNYEDTVDCLHISNLLKAGNNVLEIGPGLGYVIKSMKEKGMNVSAVDISLIGLDRIKEYCEGTYLVEDAGMLPDNYFDFIICINVIQHIPTYILEFELPHIIRSLKDTGIFAVQFISNNKYEDTGLDTKQIMRLGWDTGLGCYARTPDAFNKLIQKSGGSCKVMGELYKNFDGGGQVTGAHVFHISKI